MDDWFANQNQPQQEKEQEKSKEKFVDYKELITIYNETMSKVNTLMDTAYNAIYPEFIELMGDPKNPQQIGLINEVVNDLSDSRLRNMLIATKMNDCCKKFNNLYFWQERYTHQLEDYLNGISDLMKKAFEIIETLQKQNRMPHIVVPEQITNNNEKKQKLKAEDLINKTTKEDLSDERKVELEEMYDGIEDFRTFVLLMNPKHTKDLTNVERDYLRLINGDKQKFKGKKANIKKKNENNTPEPKQSSQVVTSEDGLYSPANEKEEVEKHE